MTPDNSTRPYTTALLAFVLFLIVLAAVAPGCGDDAAGPNDLVDGEESPSLFYPLEIDNGWSYGYSFAVGTFDPDTGAMISADTALAVFDVRLTVSEMVDSVTYLVEQTVIDSETLADTTWVRLRQDEKGLYRADIPRNVRPGPATPVRSPDSPGELVRLRYPLSPGERWAVFPGSDLVTVTVETLDTLVSPAASMPVWRLRIDEPNRGPNDWHRVWYNRCGMIGDINHSEVVAIDPETREQVRIVTDETLLLESVDLVKKRDCTVEQTK
jgi:hypothetical protein